MKKTYTQSLTLLIVLIFLVSSGYVVWKELDRAQGLKNCEEAARIAGIKSVPSSSDTLTPAPSIPEDSPAFFLHQERCAAMNQIDLNALREINSEVIAWINIPETSLSYPVLQTQNNQYYLNHSWSKEYSAAGSVFMECQCASDFSSFNTIIYAHKMRDQSMFGILTNYREEAFRKAHPDIYVITDNLICWYKVFAVHEVGITEMVYRLDIENIDLRLEFIDFCLDRSLSDTGITPTAEDHVLTLSTCTGQGHATRWVVQAVLQEKISRFAE